jgi:hypothetical protein
MKMVT